ncbi:MAG: PIG-L family deacetylase [Crocinitomicaceae bacterium]
MKTLFSALFLLLSIAAFSNKTSSEIYKDLQKLHSLKRVLYVAAHPDDENTRALAWFSLSQNAETAYLSLTRGDGGQNLIGDELSEKLGVLRTQELLAARGFDKAHQFFSRAVDFGYSKSAKESLEKWGREAILSDVVMTIRKFKPDVIITRFPPDKRGGHGHHTASAMLAIEAFEKAADPNYLPKQVAEFGTWQAASIYWNTSYWWNKEIADSAKGNDNYFQVDIGEYDPILGQSYNEIGTLARSEHKCQGFGAVIERGERIEYFEHLGGKKIQNEFFEHKNETWSDVVNPKFASEFETVLKNFNFKAPEKNVFSLLRIYSILNESLPESYLKEQKLALCEQIILDCAGIYIEVTADDYSFLNHEDLELKLNLINRSPLDVSISNLKINGEKVTDINSTIGANRSIEEKFTVKPNTILSGPYWLRNEFTDVFDIEGMPEMGLAEGPATLIASITFAKEKHSFEFDVPVEYVWRDPSYGERRRDLIRTPEFTASFDDKIAIMNKGQNKKVRVKVHAFKANLNDELLVNVPIGWKASPSKFVIDMKEKHQEQWFEFELSADTEAQSGELNLKNSKGDLIYSYNEIVYDHIPTQTIINPTKLKCVKLNAAIKKGKIAYITGVQDAVPVAIEQLGFEVDQFSVKDLATLSLDQYQSVVLGIRVYNVEPTLFNYDEKLFAYVEQGGNLVMQYNTASRELRERTFGPLPFKLSRNRVTEEDAAVEFLTPEHQILNSPNKLEKADFDNWVQERGLYFADEWDNQYEALFSWHDQGEDSQTGALIVAKHGKGQFVYTGISFFRELPNGVEGAYRLFANILSYQP